MNSTFKKENLLKDSVRKLSDNILPGVASSIALAVILAVVLRKVVDTYHLMLWLGGIVAIALIRLALRSRYKKDKYRGSVIRRYRTMILVTLAVTGMIWGCTAFWSIPPELLVYQVFITFVLGGLVAGSVGIYSAMLSAFFFFSIPTLFPMIVRFFSIGGNVYFAMGSMLFLYWGIMLITALKLNRDIIGYFMTKYENLDLISDLEAEMRVREAAEQNLREKNLEIEGIVARRTDDLLESNKKLIREIEERRLIAAALKENEEKFRELVESINDVIYSVDQQGTITYVSPVVRAVLGYDPVDLFGENFKDYVHPNDRQMFSDILAKRLAGDTRSFEYRFRTKKGEYRWVRSSSRAVFKEEEFAGIRGVLTDISGKRKLEEQLRRSHKMEAVATLSGGVAHDFNNLLAVILGNSELAMIDIPEGHSAHEYLERIVANSLKAKEVVKELLSFARQSNMDRKPINIAEAVLDEVSRLKVSLPASITLETEIADDIKTTLGDDAQIGQVVANLWDNAVDAMSGDGGSLEIEVKNRLLSPDDIDFDPDMIPGRYIQLSVRDSGIGIQGENISRLFDPYYTSKEFGRGDGLGLAVVHGIVKRHGGGIRVTSEPERGTRFDVFFPGGELTAAFKPQE